MKEGFISGLVFLALIGLVKERSIPQHQTWDALLCLEWCSKYWLKPLISLCFCRRVNQAKRSNGYNAMEGTHLPKILLWLEQLIGQWNEYNGQWRVHLLQSPTRQSPTEDNLPQKTISHYLPHSPADISEMPASIHSTSTYQLPFTQFSNRKIWKLIEIKCLQPAENF